MNADLFISAEDASDTLIALGWPVTRHGDEPGHWRIGDAVLTGDELISFAAWAPNPLQEETAPSPLPEGRAHPRPALEPIDALMSIRAIIDVAVGPATGTQVEPAIRLIQGILNGALTPPPHGTAAARRATD